MVYGWVWIAVIVLAVVVEVLTDQMVSIWFAPAGVVATILDFAKVDIIWQVLAFLVASAIGIIVAKVFLRRAKPGDESRTNVDAVIGERCIVTERIDNWAGCGQAKVKGQIWSARGASLDDVFEVGDVLDVVAVEGVKLICKKN